jgi:hypothetical protein
VLAFPTKLALPSLAGLFFGRSRRLAAGGHVPDAARPSHRRAGRQGTTRLARVERGKMASWATLNPRRAPDSPVGGCA